MYDKLLVIRVVPKCPKYPKDVWVMKKIFAQKTCSRLIACVKNNFFVGMTYCNRKNQYCDVSMNCAVLMIGCSRHIYRPFEKANPYNGTTILIFRPLRQKSVFGRCSLRA